MLDRIFRGYASDIPRFSPAISPYFPQAAGHASLAFSTALFTGSPPASRQLAHSRHHGAGAAETPANSLKFDDQSPRILRKNCRFQIYATLDVGR
jgi:hypothetical protein